VKVIWEMSVKSARIPDDVRKALGG
jgi:hypothetical protein